MYTTGTQNGGVWRVASKLWLFVVLGWSIAAPATAEVVVAKCQDEDGTVSYRDRCPPGSRQMEVLALGARRAPERAPTMDELAKRFPVTLFRVAECDTCDLVGLTLREQGIRFSEVDVENNPDAQSQLKAVSGASRVPTVTIGDEVVAGFDRLLLQQKLDDAGYPRASTQSGPR